MTHKKASAVSIISHPKINLALDILEKDESGYHKIRTVFHELEEPLDEIVVESLNEDLLEVDCDNPKVPLDSTNTVLKAAKLLKKQFGIEQGAKIFIKKRIPLMSGLGGGASNAVAALKGLARLWGLQNSEDTLRRIADQIGMDCAFFFNGGTALGEHFGEKITQLPPLPENIKFKIINTGVEISSHWAYQQVDLKKCGKNVEKTNALIEAIKNGNTRKISENLHNDFEEFIFNARMSFKKTPGKIILCGSGGAWCRVYL